MSLRKSDEQFVFEENFAVFAQTAWDNLPLLHKDLRYDVETVFYVAAFYHEVVKCFLKDIISKRTPKRGGTLYAANLSKKKLDTFLQMIFEQEPGILDETPLAIEDEDASPRTKND